MESKAISAPQDLTREARQWSHMLIGGEWRESASAERFAVFNPANGQEIGSVPDGRRAEVDAGVKEARRTFETGAWTGLSAGQRARILLRAADLIEREAEQIAGLETLNNGMPVGMSRALTMLGAETFRYFAGWCTKIHGLTSEVCGPQGMFHAYTLREPMGVAGLITPWNGPFLFACNKLAVSLAAGCSVVLKPSEEAPLTSLKLCAILADAGVPLGVVNVVTGRGEHAGAALAEHPDVDLVAFTGSTAVGRKLITAASSNMKRLILELGGKSPVIVFDDADIEAAVPAILRGIFANSGQVCMAGSRLYVQRNVYEQLVEAIAARARSLKMGDGFAPGTDLGPLISRRHLERVKALVDSGIREGAELLSGGEVRQGPGNYMSATVMTAPHADARVVREEIFGPVLVTQPFDDLEEAIGLGNDTIYGLAAAIWTRDIKRAHRLARRLRAGTVWLNCAGVLDRSVPFGGYKMSGWGRENGWEGIEAYLQTKSVIAAL